MHADQPARPSMLGITSLLLGSLGFCTAGVAGLIGFILGLTAVIRIPRSGGRVSGYGTAVAGMSVSAVSMIAGPLLTMLAAAVTVPALVGARQSAHNAKSLAILREVAAVSRSYALETGGSLPPADDWVAALADYAGGVPALVAPDGRRIYAISRTVAGRRLDDIAAPSRTVLFFEVDPGSALDGGPELLPAKPAFIEGYAIVFVDGHAENVPREQIGRLVW